MTPSRNVLVPIDFSKASRTVVNYALATEEYKNDRLVLLHAYRLISDQFSSQRDSPVELRKTIENQLKETYQKFNSELKITERSNQLEFKMEVGFTINCIRSLCKQSKFDLILYPVKDGKKNEQLAELIKLGCSAVELISENIQENQLNEMIRENLSKKAFFEGWDDYLHQIHQNPKLSFTVAPD